MKKRKLNYRFHNPNPAETAADYILRILIETNQEKVRSAVQAALNGWEDMKKETDEGQPA